MDDEARTTAWRPRPGVINTDMIRNAVSRMIQEDIPGNDIDEKEGYEFHDIKHIYLEHLDILHIDHLWIMPELTVLKLTGNLIDKIKNLENLVNLTELNLSFNRIKEIENLDKLLQLRHLSLFSNLISRIENLDSLKNLKIFSIGNNIIEDRSSVLQLRKLSLFSLNMAGNPCVNGEDFRHFIAAYIPRLEYYEYKKILDEERIAGRMIYLNDLELLERLEREEGLATKKAELQTETEETYLQAFVENLNENHLYNAIFDSDPNGQALLLMGDDIDDIFKSFELGIGKCANEIFNIGLEQFKIRQKEIQLYDKSIHEAILKSQTAQREIIERFLQDKGKTLNSCNSVKSELLSLELTLSEQIKEVFSIFERSLGDMVNSFIETAQGFFTNMREHETVLSEQLGDHASRFLTQLTVRNEDTSSLPLLLRPIMIDKEAVNTAVATSHDVHLQTIDSREDQLITRTRGWYQKLCQEYEQEEQNRFRARVNEIVTFLNLQAKDLQHEVSTAKGDEDFDTEGEEIKQNDENTQSTTNIENEN